MRHATCTNRVYQTKILPGSPMSFLRRERVSQICGLPSAPDRNGLCASCENAIHEMGELQVEAQAMDLAFDYEHGVEGTLTDAEYAALSNGGAW
jgi:hypothetical protein